MAGYGQPYPRLYGGEQRFAEQELEALVAALAPGYTDDPTTESYAELYAYAVAVGMIWELNQRLRGQLIPAKMLESLPSWEQILQVPPSNTDTIQVRRARVAAKLRGLGANALGDIFDACSALAGNNFDSLVVTPPAGVYAYWPGINPGPPGFEWSSNRAHIGVKMVRLSMSDSDFLSLRGKVVEMLQELCPAWMTFTVGIGGGFIVNQGLVGLTFL